jgi:maltose alpha-D-glucosyltransferase/alpha-amylase
VGDRPYALTLGPHDFFWFELRPRLTGPRRAAVEPEDAHALPPMLALGADSWDDLLDESARPQLEAALVPFLYRQRWFAGKTRQLRYLRVDESLPLEWGGPPARLILLRAEYAGEEADTYVLPLALARGDPAARILQERPRAIVCRLEGEGGAGVVFDALQDSEHVLGLLDGIAYQRSASANGSRLVGMAGGDRGALVDEEGGSLAPVPGRAEQSNTSIRFGNRWMLKVYRRLEPGTNLDREVGEVLTDRGFPHSPAVAGALEYRTHGREPATLAVLQRFVPNQGDAWELTADAVDRFLERALASPRPVEQLPAPEGERRGVDPAETPRKVADLVGAYLERAPLLGRRTGELHLALGAPTDDAAFAPEPFTRLYQRSLYQSHRNQAGRTFRVLARLRDELDEGRTSHELEAVLARRDRVLDRFRRVLDRRLDGLRIRVHGDYHLGQVLHTGRDFVIIDFEGEPARSVAGRRLKRSPLRDVAGMLRSFEYAAAAGVRTARERGVGSTGPEGSAVLSAWAELWRRWAAAWFLWGYERAVEGSGLLPTDPEGRASLLEAFLLEKALYEAVYEAENRPDWIRVPLEGILELTA